MHRGALRGAKMMVMAFFWLLDMSSRDGCVLVYLYILISIVTKIAVSARKWVRAVEIGSQLDVGGCR